MLSINNERTIYNFRLVKDRTAFSASEGLKEIGDFSESHIYPAGTELFEQGAPAQGVYVIEQGLVKLTHLNQEGQELIIGLRSSGWLLGATSVLLQCPHIVTAMTLNRCRARAIPAHDFLHLLKTDTQISLYLHQMQSREVCEQFLHTAELGCLSVQHRLEQLLWRLISALEMSDTRQEVKLELPLKHSEIAQLLSVTPEHLSRVLKRMQLEGILRQEKGWLIISQPHKLRHQNYFKESSYRFSVAREQ